MFSPSSIQVASVTLLGGGIRGVDSALHLDQYNLNLRARLKEREIYQRGILEDDEARQITHLKSHFRRLNSIATAKMRMQLGASSAGFADVSCYPERQASKLNGSNLYPRQFGVVEPRAVVVLHRPVSLANSSSLHINSASSSFWGGRQVLDYPNVNYSYRAAPVPSESQVAPRCYQQKHVPVEDTRRAAFLAPASPSFGDSVDLHRALCSPLFPEVALSEDGIGPNPAHVVGEEPPPVQLPSRCAGSRVIGSASLDCRSSTTEATLIVDLGEDDFVDLTTPPGSSSPVMLRSSQACDVGPPEEDDDIRLSPVSSAATPSPPRDLGQFGQALEAAELAARVSIQRTFIETFYQLAHYFVEVVVPSVALNDRLRERVGIDEASHRRAVEDEEAYQLAAIWGVALRARELLTTALYLREEMGVAGSYYY